jgi:hypothetical protein
MLTPYPAGVPVRRSDRGWYARAGHEKRPIARAAATPNERGRGAWKALFAGVSNAPPLA